VNLVSQIYQDDKGNKWVVEHIKISNGYHKFWIAECKELSLSFRSNKKSELKKEINRIIKHK
jgi:hypothetical protein